MVKAMHDGQCTVLPGQDHEGYKRKRERGLHYYNTMFTKHGIQQYVNPQPHRTVTRTVLTATPNHAGTAVPLGVYL
jgi:hypothetical protein